MPLSRTKSKTDYGADYTSDFTDHAEPQDYADPPPEVMTNSTEYKFGDEYEAENGEVLGE